MRFTLLHTSETPLGITLPGTSPHPGDLLRHTELSLMVGHPSYTTCRSLPLLEKQQQPSGHTYVAKASQRVSFLVCPAITQKTLQ